MNPFRAFADRLAPLALLLVLMALAGRLMAPTGYMPIAGPGGVQLALCSGTTVRGGDTNPHAPGDGNDCAFAIAAAHGDAPLPVAVIFAPAADHGGPAMAPMPPANLHSGIGDRSQPATGPPARA